MLNAVAAVARSIGLAGRFIAIQRAAHRAIANGMDADLQAMAVSAGGNFIELGRREQGSACIAGMAGIIVQHQRREGFQNAIHEYLHAA